MGVDSEPPISILRHIHGAIEAMIYGDTNVRRHVGHCKHRFLGDVQVCVHLLQHFDDCIAKKQGWHWSAVLCNTFPGGCSHFLRVTSGNITVDSR